jgi:predicted RNase H-like HicB family nuclease
MDSRYIKREPQEKTMRLPITVYQDEDGWYVVECPVIPGCMSQGKTQAEALQNIQEAIQLCLEVRQEQGLPLMIESLEVEVPVYA